MFHDTRNNPLHTPRGQSSSSSSSHHQSAFSTPNRGNQHAPTEERRSSDSEVSDSTSSTCSLTSSVRSTVGLVLTQSVVEKVVKGGPAEKCGLISVGDQIIAVDDVLVQHLTVPLASRLRGEIGTSLRLRIKKRSSSRIVDAELVRQPLITANYDAVGVVRTADQLRSALESMASGHKEGVRIDELREQSASLASDVRGLLEETSAWKSQAEAAYERCASLLTTKTMICSSCSNGNSNTTNSGSFTPQQLRAEERSSSTLSELLGVFTSSSSSSLAAEQQIQQLQQDLKILQSERERLLLELKNSQAEIEKERSISKEAAAELLNLQLLHSEKIETSANEIAAMKHAMDESRVAFSQANESLEKECERLNTQIDLLLKDREEGKKRESTIQENADTKISQLRAQLATVSEEAATCRNEAAKTLLSMETQREEMQQAKKQAQTEKEALLEQSRKMQAQASESSERLKQIYVQSQSRIGELERELSLVQADQEKEAGLRAQLSSQIEQLAAQLSKAQQATLQDFCILPDDAEKAIDRIMERCGRMMAGGHVFKQQMMAC